MTLAWDQGFFYDAAQELYFFFMEHYDLLMECIAEFCDMTLGDLMAFVFDADLLCFADCFEAPYDFVKRIKTSGVCKYSCNHMG